VPDDAGLPKGAALDTAIARAADRRSAVARTTTAYRLVDDAGDGLPGLVVDRYADWALANLLTEEAVRRAPDVGRGLLALGLRGVYTVRRPRADLRRVEREDLAVAAPLGEPAPPDFVVQEGELRAHVSLDDGLSTGLFIDQRDNRALVRETSGGARVLNLFAYTCTFTVAAALGGARETVSVDLSKKALSRGNVNLSTNGVAGPAHRLLASDALDFLRRTRRRGDVFDVVVLDPPSFGTRRRGTFSVERDYARLAEDAFAVLAPGGRLLAVTNHRATSLAAFRTTLERSALAAGRRIAERRALAMPEDFPHRIAGEPTTKSEIVTVG
jgi:23S rRNA (cytosine1962-C5)-methyltransferase